MCYNHDQVGFSINLCGGWHVCEERLGGGSCRGWVLVASWEVSIGRLLACYVKARRKWYSMTQKVTISNQDASTMCPNVVSSVRTNFCNSTVDVPQLCSWTATLEAKTAEVEKKLAETLENSTQFYDAHTHPLPDIHIIWAAILEKMSGGMLEVSLAQGVHKASALERHHPYGKEYCDIAIKPYKACHCPWFCQSMMHESIFSLI